MRIRLLITAIFCALACASSQNNTSDSPLKPSPDLPPIVKENCGSMPLAIMLQYVTDKYNLTDTGLREAEQCMNASADAKIRDIFLFSAEIKKCISDKKSVGAAERQKIIEIIDQFIKQGKEPRWNCSWDQCYARELKVEIPSCVSNGGDGKQHNAPPSQSQNPPSSQDPSSKRPIKRNDSTKNSLNKYKEECFIDVGAWHQAKRTLSTPTPPHENTGTDWFFSFSCDGMRPEAPVEIEVMGTVTADALNQDRWGKAPRKVHVNVRPLGNSFVRHAPCRSGRSFSQAYPESSSNPLVYLCSAAKTMNDGKVEFRLALPICFQGESDPSRRNTTDRSWCGLGGDFKVTVREIKIN